MPSNALRSSATGQSLVRVENAALPEASFTLMGWTYISVDRAASSSLLNFRDGVPYYLVYVNSGLALDTWNNVTEVVGSTLAVNTWYHVTMTVSGTGAGQWLIYLNGALNITNAGNAGVIPTFNDIMLFTNSDNLWLNGRLSNIMVWTVPLAIDEIKAQMFRTRPVVRLHKLNGWYPFKNGPYEAGRDYSSLYVPGNQNHFMVTGALTDEPGPLLQLGN